MIAADSERNVRVHTKSKALFSSPGYSTRMLPAPGTTAALICIGPLKQLNV